MTYVPIVAPSDSDIDNTEVASFPQQSRIEGFRASFANTFMNMPVFLGSNYMDRYLDDGEQWLSSGEAKKQYPNISAPNGGSKNLLKLQSNAKAQVDYNNDIMRNMQPGMLSAGARLAGSLVPFLMSPATAAVGTVSRFGASALEDALLSRVADSAIARLATKVGIGAAEVNVALTPYEIGKYEHSKYIQEPMTKKDVLYDVAGNTLFGAAAGAGAHFLKGGFNTILGFRKYLPDNIQEKVFKVSKEQMLADKHVNVEPIIKEGLARELKNNPIPDDETLNNIEKEIRPQIEKEINTINEKQDILKDKVKAQANELNDDITTSKTPSVLSVADAVHLKVHLQSANIDETNSLADNLMKSNKAIRDYDESLRKDPASYKRKDFNLKHDVINKSVNDNIDLYNKHLKISEKAILKTKKTIDKSDDIIKQKELKDKLSGFEKDADELKTAIDNVKKYKENPHKDKMNVIASNVQRLKELDAQREFHQSALDNTEALRDLRDNTTDLTNEELKTHVDHINSWKSSIFNDSAKRAEMNELLEAKEVPLSEVESFVKELKDEGVLDKDQLETFDKIQASAEVMNKLKKSIGSFIDCVIAGGAE